MDDDVLMKVLVDSDMRSFWIKPIGIPDDEPDLHAVYSQSHLSVEFANQPDAICIHDIVIVYRIGISKVIFVAECNSSPRMVTPEEIAQQPWKERWPWTIELRNLSPEYGKVWAKKSMKPFSLADMYSQNNPEDPQNLGSLQFGNDKLRISNEFGSYILRKIIRLKA